MEQILNMVNNATSENERQAIIQQTIDSLIDDLETERIEFHSYEWFQAVDLIETLREM